MNAYFIKRKYLMHFTCFDPQCDPKVWPWCSQFPPKDGGYHHFLIELNRYNKLACAVYYGWDDRGKTLLDKWVTKDENGFITLTAGAPNKIEAIDLTHIPMVDVNAAELKARQEKNIEEITPGILNSIIPIHMARLLTKAERIKEKNRLKGHQKAFSDTDVQMINKWQKANERLENQKTDWFDPAHVRAQKKSLQTSL